MCRTDFKIIVTLAGALALSGCAVDETEGNSGLLTVDNILPADYSAAGPGGIEDYLVPGAGTWQVNLDGQVQTTIGGSAVLTAAMVYDPDLDQWWVNLNGTDTVLTDFFSTDVYNTGACFTSFTCVGLEVFDDDPAVSQYGTFASVTYTNLLIVTDVTIYTHAGLKTPLLDMPAGGTGTYAGIFEGVVNYTDSSGNVIGGGLSGTADVTADFGTGGVTFASSGTSTADPGGGTYSLNGTATISGNTYDGTVTSGSFSADGVNPTFTVDPTGSSLSGAFYGPDQIGSGETAGVVYAGDASGSGEIVGGFWAPQTGYAPSMRARRTCRTGKVGADMQTEDRGERRLPSLPAP